MAKIVLILVVMEDFRKKKYRNMEFYKRGLDPCCNGRLSKVYCV